MAGRDGTGRRDTVRRKSGNLFPIRPDEARRHQLCHHLPLVFKLSLQVKDLKRQLKLERKRAEQLQQKLQEALTETRVKPGSLIFFFFFLFFFFFGTFI